MVAFNLSKILVVLASALSVSVSADANVDGNTAGPKAYEGTRSRIVKRGEGIHLVNCGSAYSAVVYCPNDGDCNRNPGSGNSCVPPPGGIARWEGATRNCRFSTGVTFTWNVRADAQNNSVRNYTSVGSGDNGFKKFNIFKDDRHIMYTDGNGHRCGSIYYALP